MSKLILDKRDPGIAEATKNCKKGDTKTFEVTVVIDKDDGKEMIGDVTELGYDEEEAPEAEPAAETETVEAMPAAGPQSAKLKY